MLEQYYALATDWEGTKYIGLTFEYDHEQREVNLSMPDYVDKVLTRFQHKKPKQHLPYLHISPKFYQKQQVVEFENTSLLLDSK